MERRKHVKVNKAKKKRNIDLMIDVLNNQYEIEMMNLQV